MKAEVEMPEEDGLFPTLLILGSLEPSDSEGTHCCFPAKTTV